MSVGPPPYLSDQVRWACRSVLHRLPPPWDLDDLLQEARLAVWRQEAADGEHAFVVARSAARTFVRWCWMRKRDPGRVLPLPDDDDPIAGRPADLDARLVVAEIYASLPPDQRAVAELCGEGGLTQIEAAAVLGWGRGRVQRQLYLARGRLAAGRRPEGD